MKIRVASLALATLLFAAGGSLRAQIYSNTFLGGLITGGSLTASCANTLGGPGHISIGISGVASTTPYGGNVDITTGSVAGVLRLGLLQGATLGPSVHGILSVDAFARAGQLLLAGNGSDGAGFWGLGGRVGILRNSILTPAVSVSLAYHETGRFALAGQVVGQLLPATNDLSVTSLRVDVSKNFFLLTPYAGLGTNRVKVKARGLGAMTETKTENVLYAGVEWNVLVLRLGLEVMRNSGETVGTGSLRITF